MEHHPFFRQEARRAEYRAENQERDRVLRLIRIRRDIWRHKGKGGTDDEHLRSMGALNVLDELERAVQQGHHR